MPLDHPWFSQATFNWPNSKGGVVASVHITGPPGAPSLPNQGDIETCLEATYGKPRTDDVDHLKAMHSSTFKLPDGNIRVSQFTVDIDVDTFAARYMSAPQRKAMRLPPPMTKSGWSKVLATLNACGAAR